MTFKYALKTLAVLMINLAPMTQAQTRVQELPPTTYELVINIQGRIFRDLVTINQMPQNNVGPIEGTFTVPGNFTTLHKGRIDLIGGEKYSAKRYFQLDFTIHAIERGKPFIARFIGRTADMVGNGPINQFSGEAHTGGKVFGHFVARKLYRLTY